MSALLLVMITGVFALPWTSCDALTPQPFMSILLPVLIMGAYALPWTSCVNCSETDVDGRSNGNSFAGYNSYTPESKNVNSDSNIKTYNQIDSNSFGVGSSFVVSASDHTPSSTNKQVSQPAYNTNDYYSQPAYNSNDYYSQPAYKARDYHSQPAYNANDHYSQPANNANNYYSQPDYPHKAQDRFHPHKSKPDAQLLKAKPGPQVLKAKPEDDSHTGEVVLPPVSTSQDLLASGSSIEDTFVEADPTAQGSAGFEVPADSSPGQYQTYTYPQPSPPPLPGGYDYYQPPPPPPPRPPPTKPTPYYYYPPPAPPAPSNQYLPAPAPSPPPAIQYLPAPTPPPLQEERQSDYTYYYLGPKLWYVPLFFSIYFVLYVGALIIKAVSRHKILFPQHLYNAATSVYQARGSRLEEVTAKVTKDLAQAALRYLTKRKQMN